MVWSRKGIVLLIARLLGIFTSDEYGKCRDFFIPYQIQTHIF